MNRGELIAERFEIDRFAARGGMGEVYRAFDRHTGELAALKVVKSDGSSDVLQRFTREARVLSGLQHPAIVRYLGHGRAASGQLYLAMEWLEGEDLATRLHAGNELSIDEVVRLATRAAAALAAAHARGVVHRDIKPSNLFLAGDRVDDVKLLDFGVARLVGGLALTASGLLVGTPAFMAPEQLAGERDVGPPADVFALGAVIYRCLCGRNPFEADSVGALVAVVAGHDPPPVRSLRPEVPAALDELIARMLAKRPRERFDDAGTVLARLIALGVPFDDTRRAGALTASERHPLCLVVARGAPAERIAAAAAVHDVVAEAEAGCIVVGGQPLAADLARQAARCALALRAVAPDAAIAVVTGYGVRGASPVGGALFERARGLLRGAEIRIDDVTAGLLDGRFVVAGDAHGLTLWGGDADLDPSRTLMGRPTPFVGRDAELGALEGIVDSCGVDGIARAVLISAPPGVGKSRLQRELAARARDRGVEVWLGRGDPVRAGGPYALLGDVIRHTAGARHADADGRALLRERLGRSLRPERVEPVAELLGEIAGLPAGAEASAALVEARRAPALLAERIRAAWQEWLDAECREGALLILLDDIHWSDAISLRLVDQALAALAERPLVVVGLGRPEVAEQFPNLWVDRGLQRIHLAPLSRRASERLARRALGEQAPAAMIARVVDQAQGNAFYLEELVRHVAGGAAAALPESVVAMAQSRLALLDGEARRVLRAASVFGEVCWRRGIRALVGDAPAERLGELVAQELLQRSAGSRFPGEEELVFRHAIVRDAAYATLTEHDRTLGHRLAARWLDALAAATRDDGAVAREVAHHAALADEHELAARACVEAARRALRLFAQSEALDLAERGRHHVPHLPEALRPVHEIPLLDVLVAGGGERRTQELEVDLLRAAQEAEATGLTHLVSQAYTALGRLHYQANDFARAAEYAERAAEVGRLTEPTTAVDHMAHSARCFAFVGRIAAARRLLAEAQLIAARHGVSTLQLRYAEAPLAHHDGDHQRAVEIYEETLERVRTSHDHYMECECLERLALIALERGRLEDASRRAAELRAVGERLAIDGAMKVAEAFAALVELRHGGLEAAASFERAVAGVREVDNRTVLAIVLVDGAELALELGDTAAAARRAEEALAAAGEAGSVDEAVVAAALLARLASRSGDHDAARERLSQLRARSGAELSARARVALARAERDVVSVLARA